MTTDDRTAESQVLQQRWHGWASPVGLGLLLIGGFFALLAEGLATMSAI